MRDNRGEKRQRAALKFTGERSVASALAYLDRSRYRLIHVPGILSGEREARRTRGERQAIVLSIWD